MLHTSLHWDDKGVDDILFWNFCVKHAAWIYNGLPNSQNGFTPKTKMDHWDLLSFHVWVCTDYVLDTKLQNYQKIKKWNRKS